MGMWHLKDEAVAESFMGKQNYTNWSYLITLISVFIHYSQSKTQKVKPLCPVMSLCQS